MEDKPLQVTPRELYLAPLGIHVPVVRVEERGDYFPVRGFCKVAGIPSNTQLERLKNDPDFEDGLLVLSVVTAGGAQDTLCLRKRELAWWLGTLETRVVRKLETHLGITLAEFKRILMDAADRLMWGVTEVPPERALTVPAPSGATHLYCLRCRAHHVLEIGAGAVSWELAE